MGTDWDTFWSVINFGIGCAAFILLIVGLSILPIIDGILITSLSFIVLLVCFAFGFAKGWIE